jgi:diadenosine tetraphosphate (Ap4A) HIT family hydrolase
VLHVHLHVLPRFVGDGIGFVAFGKHDAMKPSREELDEVAAAIRRAL